MTQVSRTYLVHSICFSMISGTQTRQCLTGSHPAGSHAAGSHAAGSHAAGSHALQATSRVSQWPLQHLIVFTHLTGLHTV